MSSQVSTKVSKKEYNDIRNLVNAGFYINTSDFVRDAVRRRLAEFRETATQDSPATIELRVYEFFKNKGGSGWPDEAAAELGYSVLQVLDALERLRSKGKAEEVAEVGAVVR